MPKPFFRMPALLLTLDAALLNPPSTAKAADAGLTTLDVNGEAVRVYRDDFGVPHIFAGTNGAVRGVRLRRGPGPSLAA
jgi:acyl-homoserine lactone acylase PvdQ